MTGPEWEFQNFIKETLAFAGYDVVVIADVRASFQATSGTPDLYVRHPNKKHRFWIEVKAPESYRTTTGDQDDWAEMERKCGGEVELVDSREAFQEMLDKYETGVKI